MKKIIMAAAVAVIMPLAVSAVPAKRGPMVFSQPDGTTVALQKIGDERAHILLTADGYPVVCDETGYYRFADFGTDGSLCPTSVKVSGESRLSAAEQAVIDKIDKNKIAKTLELRQASSPMSVNRKVKEPVLSRSGSQGIGLMDDAFFGCTELKGLVILAQYKDVKFSEDCDLSHYVEMLNRQGYDKYGATGSARDYFIDSSNGQFTPDFDVYGPVTLPQNMAYYGANNASGSDKNAVQMIYDACVGLDDEIDFSEYDLDGDGYVDNVFVFYAGYGEATYGPDESIWPHQWSLSYGHLDLTLDGVKVNKYACTNELERDASWQPVPGGIGTFVHEFSHVLGLPDLYVTSGALGEWTPGAWNVLDQGPYNNNGRTPPAYSVYERNALGWIAPIVIDGSESIELEAINAGNEACIVPTGNVNEFFLIENRQQTGWDQFIPGHGMLIWHIDYNASTWEYNMVNNQRLHNNVDIEEARGDWARMSDFSSMAAYEQALADYAFPGSRGVTSFTDNTKPSMKTWSGKKLGLPITDIEENDGVISFNVAGGRCDAGVPVVKEPSAIGDHWFEAAWESSEGAAGYVLSVKAYIDKAEPVKETADFTEVNGSISLPQGWTFLGGAGGAGYSTEGSFGESAPALRLSKSGMGVMTRLFDNDVESVGIWTRGYTTNSASKLIIEGLVGDEWVELAEVLLSRTEGVMHSLDEMPEGVRQVRLTYKQSLGNASIDDFMVAVSGIGYKNLDGYEKLPVGDVCAHRVENLIAGVTEYVYKVCAVDTDGRRSAWSEEQMVTVANNAGIDDVECEMAEKVVAVGSTISYQGVPNSLVRLIDPMGRVVLAASTDNAGRVAFEARGEGLFIVAAPGGAHRVLIRQ